MRSLLLLWVGLAACSYPESPSSLASPRVPGPPLDRAQMRDVFDPAAQAEDRPTDGEQAKLQVLDMQPLGRSAGADIVLRFDRTVAAADALPAVKLVVESQARDGGWKSVAGKTTWTRTDRLGFEPNDDFPSAHRIRVRLDGQVQDVQDVQWTFETGRPTIEVDEPWKEMKPRESVRISVDEPTSAKTLAKHLRVKGPDGRDIPIRVRAAKAAADSEGEGLSWFTVQPRSRWPDGSVMTVAVAPSFRAKGGVLRLGAPLEWTLSALLSDTPAPGEASLVLSSGWGIFGSVDDARIGVLSELVAEAQVRVAVLGAEAGAAYVETQTDTEALPWPSTGEQAEVLLRFPKGRRGESGRTLDLGRWAKAGDTVVVEVRATELVDGTTGILETVRGVFRISGLGVWVHSGPARGIVRVTELETGHPRAGVAVKVRGASATRELGETDLHGIVHLPGAVALGAHSTVFARAGADALAVPLATYDWEARRTGDFCKVSSAGVCQWSSPLSSVRRMDPASEAPPAPLLRGERVVHGIEVGRGLYMPGDTVHVAGWAGISTPHGEHNNRRLPEGVPVELALQRAGRGPRVEVAIGRTEVNAHGRFAESLTVPEGAALGSHVLVAKILGTESRTWLLVAEPRIPAFEVKTRSRRRSVRRGDPLIVDTHAKYFSGEPAPMHQLDWTVTCSETTPYLADLEDGFRTRTDAHIPTWSAAGNLETGQEPSAVLSVTTDALDHRSQRSCDIEVSAQDASRQPIGAEDSVLVDPGPGFLAVKIPHIEPGTRPQVRARVVGQRGRPMKAESIRIRLERGWEQPRLVVTSCETLDPEAKGASLCGAPTLAAGRYTVHVTAEVGGEPLDLLRHIKVGQRVRQRRATEPKTASPSIPPREQRPFKVWADQTVDSGESFDVRIDGPWSEASGVLTLEQSGLRESRPFAFKGGKTVVRVAARRGAGELLQLTARVARPPERGMPPRVERASLSVKVRDRERLSVVVVPPEHPQPGTKSGFEVRVRDDENQPVDARLAIWVVDDALHSLRQARPVQLGRIFNPILPHDQAITDPHLDLLRPFFPDLYEREKKDPRVRTAKASIKGALDVDIRHRFVPVPLFVGDLATGPDGVARVPLQLADDLTRFRIHVVASAELADGSGTGPARFGAADGTFEVTAPLPVRAALPRALRPGDDASIAAIVTAPAAGELEVVAHSDEKRVHVGGTGIQTRRVSSGDVVRVSFPVHATTPGDAHIRFSATLRTGEGEVLRGAVVRPMPVSVERTAIERAAVYGSLDSDRPIAVPLVLPASAHGSVDVVVSSTILGELQEAADYLADYPYGCIEQTSSRLIPLVAMRGRLAHPQAVDARISKALAHLQSMQLDDGRFAYWPGGREPSSFGTAYATWVLLQAKEAGVMVPRKGLERALQALAHDAETELSADAAGRERVLIERALSVWALAYAGTPPAGAFDTLWPYRQDMPVFARLLFLQALHRADPADPRIKPLLLSVSASIEQRAGVAHVVEPTEDGRWWYAFSSEARTEALTLMTLLQVSPDDPRIEKLVRGLRDRRRAGRWRTTQENAFGLLAMSRYAALAEPEEPKQRVQAWIGAKRVVDAEFVGFEHDSLGGAVGLRQALEGAPRQQPHVVVQREGKGRTYYRVGVEWTAQGDAPARSQGLSISRTMPASVTLGQRTLVEIELSTDATQHHVAVEVPLPAGLEAVDTQLGAGVRARVTPGVVSSGFLSHQELRPDRIVLFFDQLPPGTTRHTVPLIATTPGRFEVPAAVAEAMYEPETRARTTRATMVVTVKQKRR